ncbi:hypothetical protein GDO81_001277 [Engystomops pustulosus]|uniref:Intercellular adhesion molecule N-terminal domain-containing protein n=1 Tax=Engystomops pustulosus TaxID=76066 RepID=A0AAV7DB39_ENGPU|nr:hypothetical protein GDO81_001277 [Engystomops pustulosus]
MAPCLLLAIILHRFLLGNAQHLTVHPVDPVVAVGSSIQLNCSLNCSSGRVAWKGLDIYQTNQIIAPGYSVQTLENISISIGGRKYCEGTCPGQRKTYHKSVELHVYALPKTLLLSNSMKNGVHYLNCSVERVLPPLHITCYRGSEMLAEPIDMNEVPVVDDLYNVMGSWVIPEEDWLSQASYRCEAEVSVNGQVFKSQGVLNISSKDAAVKFDHELNNRHPTLTIPDVSVGNWLSDTTRLSPVPRTY